MKTLEFLIDETGYMYSWTGVWISNTLVDKKKKPGPCRVVYSETDGHYCGVMCHKEYNDVEGQSSTELDKGFELCKA